MTKLISNGTFQRKKQSIRTTKTFSSTLIKNGSATLLAAKRPAGGVPEVNLRSPLLAGDEAHKRGDQLWIRIQGQMSTEVQNKSINNPTKITNLPIFSKEKFISLEEHIFFDHILC